MVPKGPRKRPHIFPKSPMPIHWEHQTLEPKSYTCGYCGNPLSSVRGWRAKDENHQTFGEIYLCHHCHKPTFFTKTVQIPGTMFGEEVSHIKDADVKKIYNEARNCMQTQCFTSAVLCCRKLLMHVAVAQGAKPGLQFVKYVEYMSDQGIIPNGCKGWVVHIKDRGNEENHEITIATKEEAERLISFSGMLLKLIYEYPASVPVKNPSVI